MINFDDPKTFASLAALSALGQAYQPSRLPRNPLASLMSAAGAYGQGGLAARNSIGASQMRNMQMEALKEKTEREKQQRVAWQDFLGRAQQPGYTEPTLGDEEEYTEGLPTPPAIDPNTASLLGLMSPREGVSALFGLQTGKGVPSNIQEWRAFQQMSPEDQARYLLMKRAQPPINLGGSFRYSDPANPAAPPVAEIPTTLEPGERPDVREKQAAAAARGAGQAKRQLDLRKTFPKARSALRSLEQKSQFLMNTIDKALESVSGWSTGYGASLAFLPNAPARKLENYLTTIKANVGFDRLQEMRENSPTGGALGQVSEMENRLLQAVNGALDPYQRDQLVENLKIIRETYPKVLAERQRAFMTDYGAFVNQKITPAAPANKGGSRFDSMSLDDLGKLDMKSLSAEELKQASERWQNLQK